MKKKIAVLAAVAVILIATMPAFAGGPPNNGNSHEKATGEVWFSTPWGNVHINFNAHETDPAKGWLYWERITGSTNWWSGPVVFTHVYGKEADFTVRVEEGDPVVVGCDITFHVIDNGTPARNGDLINITAVVNSPSETCAADGQIQGPYSNDDFYEGNLVVHGRPCDIYTLDINTVNGNPAYPHYFEITFCPNEEPFGEGYGDEAGSETVSLIEFDDNTNTLSFRSDYNKNTYYWFPSFILEENNSLTFQDGYGSDNVYDATGTWSMYSE
jgi:hypothetical protein